MPAPAPRSIEGAASTADAALHGFDFAPGFRAASVACGLKASGALDLSLIVADRPCAAAGVFTTNRVQAAPVLHDRETLARSAGRIRAVIANSGCANACTGEPGLADARRAAERVAAAIGCRPDQVLVLSTGVIGRRLDMERVTAGIEAAAGLLAAGAPAPASPQPTAGGAGAAHAILTTDTRPKTAAADAVIGGRRVAIRGIAKGAGMIHPDMATLLAVITTDADLEPAELDLALRDAVARSFNRISVDGDMSTNDTILLLASGASGAGLLGDDDKGFQDALEQVCVSLARQVARDGEGATRLVEITVSGAASEPEAHRVADAIARSALVKTAIHGGDPNWGRILAAAGSSGVPIDPERLGLHLEGEGGRIELASAGLPAAFSAAEASALLSRDPVVIRLDLGMGAASATVWTCDLSAEYVSINAHYTT